MDACLQHGWMRIIIPAGTILASLPEIYFLAMVYFLAITGEFFTHARRTFAVFTTKPDSLPRSAEVRLGKIRQVSVGSPRPLMHRKADRLAPKARRQRRRPCALGAQTSQSTCSRSSQSAGLAVVSEQPSHSRRSRAWAPAGSCTYSSRLSLRRCTCSVSRTTGSRAQTSTTTRSCTRKAKRAGRSASLASRSATR